MTYRPLDILQLYAEHRLVREARARKQALAATEATAEAAAFRLQPNPVPVTAMKPQPSRIDLGGFSFKLPGGFAFQDVQMRVVFDGQPVMLKVQRREVSESDQLAPLFDAAMKAICEPYADLRIIQRYDALFAGSEAKGVDFSFREGEQSRHCRLVGSIVPLLGAEQRQWLSISSVMDPSRPGLAAWLIDFDTMLGAVTAA